MLQPADYSAVECSQLSTLPKLRFHNISKVQSLFIFHFTCRVRVVSALEKN